MEFSEIVKLECCEVDFTAANKNEALHNIGKLLKRSREFRNIEKMLSLKLLKRERQWEVQDLVEVLRFPIVN